MTETKTRELLLFSPLEDEPAIETLPDPIPLTPEQLSAQAEADERDRQRQLEWAQVVQALQDNSLAVFRAMRRFRNDAEQEQVERVLTSYEDGSFLNLAEGAAIIETWTGARQTYRRKRGEPGRALAWDLAP